MAVDIVALPDDIMIEILSYVGVADVVTAARVCKKWKTLSAISISDHERRLSAFLGRNISLSSKTTPLLSDEVHCFQMDPDVGLCESPVAFTDECVCYIIGHHKLGYFRINGYTEVDVSFEINSLVSAPSAARPATVGICSIDGLLFENAWFILTDDGRECVWTETQIAETFRFNAEVESDVINIDIQTIIPDIGAKSVSLICNAERRGNTDGGYWYAATLPIGSLAGVVVRPVSMDWVPLWFVLPVFFERNVLLARYSSQTNCVEFRYAETGLKAVQAHKSQFVIKAGRKADPWNTVGKHSAATEEYINQYTVKTMRRHIAMDATALSRKRFVAWSGINAWLVDGTQIVLPPYKKGLIEHITSYGDLIIIARAHQGGYTSQIDVIYCCPAGSMVPFSSQIVPFKVAKMAVVGSQLLVYTFTPGTTTPLKQFKL